MRSSKQRSRSKPNRPRTMGNIVNRVFDSSGPEGKVRGTPQQIIEKYQVLARDAQLSNDRVAYENFLQHSEHYTRMLGEATRELQREADERRDSQGQPRSGDQPDMRYDGQPSDDRDDDNGDTEPFVDQPRQQQLNQPRNQHQPRPQQQPRNDQDRFQNDRFQNDRPQNDRPQNDRPQNDRAQNDRSQNDRTQNDRSQNDRSQNDRSQNDRSQNDRAQNDRQGDRQPDRQGDRQPDRQADRQPRDRQPRDRQPQPGAVDLVAELPAFISAPMPKVERPAPERPTLERPAPERPTLAEVIDLDSDRDTDSGLVDTPEMPADENAKPAPRRRTVRKPKADKATGDGVVAEKAAE